jgi:cell division protein ZapA
MSDKSENTGVIKVVIFGEEHSIRSSDDSEYVTVVADYVDKKMRDIATKNKNLSPNKIAMLAALNIAGELFDLRKKSENSLSDVEIRTKNILELLDSKLSPSGTDIS